MRYLVAILIAGILLLGFRVLFRRRGAGRGQGVPVARWPWLILAVALLLVALVGLGLREVALVN
ncbi:MAG: hypothetical protein O9284_01695 [Steroidobacteraceae bacterium]|jgi:hypothetical protein|nr:hypothetical protein [Steroidobacteraceae bacterium]